MAYHWTKCIHDPQDHRIRSTDFEDSDEFRAWIISRGWTLTERGWVCDKCNGTSEEDDDTVAYDLPGIGIIGLPKQMTPEQWDDLTVRMGAIRTLRGE